jgi:hypothetical protein
MQLAIVQNVALGENATLSLRQTGPTAQWQRPACGKMVYVRLAETDFVALALPAVADNCCPLPPSGQLRP